MTIFDEPAHIEPVKVEDYGAGQSPTLVASHSPKLHRASISGKKMTGRPALPQSGSSTSLARPMSFLNLENASSEQLRTPAESKTPDPRALLSQVVDWLQEEKMKRRKWRLHRPHRHHQHHHDQEHVHARMHDQASEEGSSTAQDSSIENDADLSLEKLENILAGFAASSLQSFPRLANKSSSSLLRKGSIARKFKRSSVAPQSSDTEFFGDDVMVPNVEAHLDNSKTMAFTGGAADDDTNEHAKKRDHEHWITFKEDIVRLTHTLKLKGWRRIPMDRAKEIDVVRLSGALTNAVYVVRPPKDMPEQEKLNPSDPSTNTVSAPKWRPLQLLLRIYGPQVEHLIDREYELSILRRLARKRIGPRLLGSFENGRFEEFLHAETLTAEDLRVPETSKQIAKRMRELHDGIDLLESELEAGPAVFLNWDKWVDRCEKIITWLDGQVHQAEAEEKAGTAAGQSKVNPRYVRRGLICGVDWPVFRKTYDAYRKRLIAEGGGMKGVRKSLLFAHNDTQYGNLMRLQPSGTSPLLQPSNHHKQLVVIDFEYASQNMAGLEFANHFTEWCYNYHHAELNFVCDTRRYPDEKEQYRFVRSYVMHRPQFNASASATPKMEGREKTNISDFMLDARAPPSAAAGGSEMDYDKEESEREKAQEEEIQRLLRETRVWRLANSAQWVAWGIVQAKIPELDALEKEQRKKSIAGAVVDKVKEMTGMGKSIKAKDHLHPLSDPMSEEEKRLQEESHHDRPEGRFQEEAHREGDGDKVLVANSRASSHERGDGSTEANGDKDSETLEEEPEEFDYLAYAQERAMFFWGDCLQMGLVKEEDLPEGMRARVKLVGY